MFKIGDVEIKNPVVVAPMAGVSNSAFRSICYEFKAGLVYSEMISDKALHYKSKKTEDMTQSLDIEHPLTMQIFGSDEATMVEAAQYLDKKTSCDIIDINMGCPVTKIIKSNAGSAMLKDIDKGVDIVKKIVEAVDKPVSVKMRLGWSKEDIVCLDLSKMLEGVGVKAVAIHGRTKTQMYEGQAEFTWIKRVKEAVKIPVIANGDIRSVVDAKRVLDETGCDAIMVGRGAIGNPFLIKQLANYFENKSSEEISYDDRINMALDHAKRLCELSNESVAIKQMRGLASWYIQGMPHSARVKNATSTVESLKDLEDLYLGYLKDLKTL